MCQLVAIATVNRDALFHPVYQTHGPRCVVTRGKSRYELVAKRMRALRGGVSLLCGSLRWCTWSRARLGDRSRPRALRGVFGPSGNWSAYFWYSSLSFSGHLGRPCQSPHSFASSRSNAASAGYLPIAGLHDLLQRLAVELRTQARIHVLRRRQRRCVELLLLPADVGGAPVAFTCQRRSREVFRDAAVQQMRSACSGLGRMRLAGRGLPCWPLRRRSACRHSASWG